jgi:hypothetical protein
MKIRALWMSLLMAAVSVVWAQPAMGSCGAWQKVAAAPGVHGGLFDVSASSATNAWAVGSARDRTLAERWNGSVWRRVPTPSPGGVIIYRGDMLTAVVAIAPDDAWAVGRYGEHVHGTPLLLHWNGVVWQRRTLPHAARHASLWDMTAISARDIWAVGSSRYGVTRTLHYDGSRWRVIPAVNRGPHATLLAVAATSADDVWAVGYTPATLTEHWDGHMWSLAPASRRGGPETGVAAVSPNEAWGVGYTDHGHMSVIDRWDGSTWTTVHAITGGPHLASIAAASATDAWAVGGSTIVHWDGTTWTPVTITALLPISITSVTHVPGLTAYWAVGSTSHRLPGTTYNTPRIEARC